MKPGILLGLLAILPVALNTAPTASAATPMATALICSGDGSSRYVTIPQGGDKPSREGNQSCCVKACHGGHSRKRFVRNN